MQQFNGTYLNSMKGKLKVFSSMLFLEQDVIYCFDFTIVS